MKNLQELLVIKGLLQFKDIDGIIGPKTILATQKYITKEINKRGWIMPITDLLFIRLDQTLTNTYDDIAIRFNNGKIDKIFSCSTTAGDYYIFNPITDGGITGTGIVAEQQVLKAHQFITSANWKSLWLGGPYMNQVNPIKYYRDGNKNRVLDKGTVYTGVKGFNQHHGGNENIIYNWSAGCFISHPTDWYDAVSIFTANSYHMLTIFEV